MRTALVTGGAILGAAALAAGIVAVLELRELVTTAALILEFISKGVS